MLILQYVWAPLQDLVERMCQVFDQSNKSSMFGHHFWPVSLVFHWWWSRVSPRSYLRRFGIIKLPILRVRESNGAKLWSFWELFSHKKCIFLVSYSEWPLFFHFFLALKQFFIHQSRSSLACRALWKSTCGSRRHRQEKTCNQHPFLQPVHSGNLT